MSKHLIADMEEYKSLTAGARQAGYVHTNCYLMRDAVRAMVGEGRLYALEPEAGLVLLEADRGGFYRVYYYLSAGFQGPALALDRDAVIEFPYMPPLEADARRRDEPALIRRLGFVLGRESAFRTADAGEALTEPPLLPEGYAVNAARPEQAEDILALFGAYFEPLYAFLPTADELRQRIAEGCVFAAVKDGALIGALDSHREKQAAVCDHVALRPACRGLGVSKALLAAHHRRYQGLVRTYQAWTDRSNRPAMGMYTSAGYGNTAGLEGRAANEYILRKASGVRA